MTGLQGCPLFSNIFESTSHTWEGLGRALLYPCVDLHHPKSELLLGGAYLPLNAKLISDG